VRRLSLFSRPFVSLTQDAKLAKDTYLVALFSLSINYLTRLLVLPLLCLSIGLPTPHFAIRNPQLPPHLSTFVFTLFVLSLALFASLREAKLVSLSLSHLNVTPDLECSIIMHLAIHTLHSTEQAS